MKLMWFQIGIGKRKNNYNKNYSQEYDSVSALKLAISTGNYFTDHDSLIDQIRELAPRTAAFCVLNSEARSLTLPL